MLSFGSPVIGGPVHQRTVSMTLLLSMSDRNPILVAPVSMIAYWVSGTPYPIFRKSYSIDLTMSTMDSCTFRFAIEASAEPATVWFSRSPIMITNPAITTDPIKSSMTDICFSPVCCTYAQFQ